MQDPYGAFRRDLMSSLRLSGQAARQVARGRASAIPNAQFDPAEYVPVDTSGVGEFPWQWDNFGTFNAQTWNFLNTVAAKTDTGALHLTGGLTTWYYNIISATAYLWTDDDKTDVAKQLSNARSAQSQLIQDYQSLFAPVSPADRQAAASALGVSAASTLVYIVDYQIGYVWSGRQASGMPPLTASQIRAADLGSLFANAPGAAKSTMLPGLQAALQYERAWATQVDLLWNRSRSIRDAAENTGVPDVANQSGMYTVDRSGANVVRHSFSVKPSVNDIQTALSSSHTMEMSFSVQDSGAGDAIVSVPGKTAARVPRSVLAVTPHKGVARDVLSHDGAGDRADVRVTYHGPVEITVGATPFAQERATGWYYEYPIVEAAMNQAQGKSAGYQFQLPVGAAQFGATGVGTLQKLLVCRSVTLEVAYPNGDAARLANSAPTGAGAKATLLGNMHIAASSKHAAVAQVRTDAGTGTPSLVLNVGESGAGGTPGSLAHVIGARISRPFPTVAPAVQSAIVAPMLFAMPLSKAAPPAPASVALVQSYERLFGPVTSARMKKAGAQTPLAYILHHVLGSEWSGTAARHMPPLTMQQMRAARQLRLLFPEMPLEGAEVLTELHAYLSQTADAQAP
ncbi:hypothetical protein KUV51_17060 [Tateyamaria omphalii]|uniref:hypothetical protein n=1 Tax=Tateyamaria omphalii TaxID=299262 RepID=UPI001C99AB12|nr:hypothetical protein [Tateyamaria omphalii]MBY5934720.1 hypothetical protein [Tateyamaria omphalii]